MSLVSLVYIDTSGSVLQTVNDRWCSIVSGLEQRTGFRAACEVDVPGGGGVDELATLRPSSATLPHPLTVLPPGRNSYRGQEWHTELISVP